MRIKNVLMWPLQSLLNLAISGGVVVAVLVVVAAVRSGGDGAAQDAAPTPTPTVTAAAVDQSWPTTPQPTTVPPTPTPTVSVAAEAEANEDHGPSAETARTRALVVAQEFVAAWTARGSEAARGYRLRQVALPLLAQQLAAARIPDIKADTVRVVGVDAAEAVAEVETGDGRTATLTMTAEPTGWMMAHVTVTAVGG